MRPPFFHSLVVALVALCVFGCRAKPDDARSETSRRVQGTDDRGRITTLDLPVARVLSLAPNLTEIVFAIGAGNHLLAVSQADTYPAGVRALPRFSTFPLDHERIVELGPDLLLATDEINSPTDADALARVGVPTYFFAFRDVASIPRGMRTLGGILGVDPEPAALGFEASVDSVRRAFSGRHRPRTLLLVSDDVLYAFGRESYASEAVRIAGGDNLTDAFDGAAAVVSAEFVLESRPEVVIVLMEGSYAVSDLLKKHPTWGMIPAVVEGRVHAIHPDLLSRPGPRLARGIAQLASLLHPDVSTLE